MRTNIKTYDVKVTRELQMRIDWICSKLEKLAEAKHAEALHCDFVITKRLDLKEGEMFQASVRFFDASGIVHFANASAKDPLTAIDNAHDEIERNFFQQQRIKRESQKIAGLKRLRQESMEKAKAEETKKYGEPPADQEWRDSWKY